MNFDNGHDLDLSTAPALLPNGLVFMIGKAWTAYTLRRSHLGHIGGQLQTKPNFCGDNPDGGIADLGGLLFVPCRDGLRAVRPTASSPPTPIWHSKIGPNSSPIVAGGLVWSIANGAVGNQGDLFALNPNSGAVVQKIDVCCSASELSFAIGRRWSPSGPRPVPRYGAQGTPRTPGSALATSVHGHGLRTCGQRWWNVQLRRRGLLRIAR